MYKIYIVEDDNKLCNLVEEGLKKWKFDAVSVKDFDNITEEFLKEKPHLVLLDINLPSFDGFYWCEQIRAISKVPIIFISSRDTKMDMVMAINMGGDDFISKPFSIDVLIAKINAMLRRTYSYKDVESNFIKYKNIILNTSERVLKNDEENIELTKNEYKILETLMNAPNKVISRDLLMRKLWEDESFIDDNTLTVNVNRLRKKLIDHGIEDLIKTKKGQGYILD